MAELTPDARAFLSEIRFAALATINKDGTPQQSTMWYELDGDTVLMNTAAGRVKYHNLMRDPRASICVVDGYRWVTISGQVELNDNQTIAQADIKRLAIRYDGPEEGEKQAQESFSKQRRVTIRLKIDRVVEDL
jgi:PPOX class probable F420-dependent enzyme